jgi:membrane protease YdiL (CAAX protease family)
MQFRPRLLPVVLAIAVAPALHLLRLLVDRLVDLRALGPGALGRGLVGEFALLLATIAIVAWARWWRPTGLVGPWRQPWWTALVAVWLAMPLLFGLPVLLRQGVLAPVPQVLALAAMVGFCEETLTRGVMLYGLSKYGPLIAGLVSASIFGALHSLNYLDGVPVSYLVDQVVTAALLGLMFAGLRLRMLTLWPMIVAHAVVDVPGLLEGFPLNVPPESPTVIIVSIGVMLPFGMAGLGLLLWEQLHGRNPLVDQWSDPGLARGTTSSPAQ